MLCGTMTFDKILIVDDEISTHRVLEHHLCKKQYKVAVTGSVAQARKRLSEECFDLLILDICLPDGDGREILKSLMAEPEVPPVVILMSTACDVDTALQSIREGAFDYLRKPFAMEELDVMIKRAESFSRVLRMNRYMERELHGSNGVLLGESAALLALRAGVERFTGSETPIQIVGEAGVGKVSIAEELHRRGSRAGEPLVKVNCAVGSEEQLERELFGSEEAPGWLEFLNGGTLLLEMMNEMPLCTQQKMVRIIQERCYERPGSGRMTPIDIHFLISTHEDLQRAAAEGRFIPELAKELAGAQLRVPPLRERLEDLPALVQHWFDTAGRRHGCANAALPPESMERLKGCPWLGNLSELWNALERAVMVTGRGKVIAPESFSFLSTASFASGSIGLLTEEGPLLTLEEMERRHVLRALAYTNQNRTRAAGLLKISVRTLRNKLHLYRFQGVEVGECRQSELPMIAPSVSPPRLSPGK